MSDQQATAPNFIRHIIDEDLAEGKNEGRVVTRFPPEPNGYLHIGHAKSICLNFGLARDYGGRCNLRFDDTNPDKEQQEYVDAIVEDVRWLGFQWEGEAKYASDYFERLYQFAVELIEAGKAYVDSLTPEQIRAHRGTLTEAGTESPYRERSVAENLDLFERMRAGEFAEGEHVLRAKIDMSASNMNLRDPTLYRIRRQHHLRTGDKWCIYPLYDYTHCLSDALEGVTHSLCTLEFEDHRPLYDWVLDNVDAGCHPQQIEFAKLSLEYAVTSKRKLNRLVQDGYVDAWDDPRMPTISALRRRGYTPASLREFAERIGVTKKEQVIEMSLLESCVRDDLNAHAPRAMAVLRPLKLVIDNYPEDRVETLSAPRHPQDETMGEREIQLTREIYIDREDFREAANKKFKRLVLGGEVRLRNAYVIHCHEAIKDDDGEIIELRCTYDEATLGAQPEGRKVKGVIHWVSMTESEPAEVRLYDRLFNKPEPGRDQDFIEDMNPDSLQVWSDCRVEKGLASAQPEAVFQFEREGYFCADRWLHGPERLVFNRTVTLRDTWAKIEAAEKGEEVPSG